MRHIRGPQRLPASVAGVLPRRKLRTLIEYIMENLGGNLTLEQMAAVVCLSPYHFVRLFKAATGVPPHTLGITTRVARARPLRWTEADLGLLAVARAVAWPHS